MYTFFEEVRKLDPHRKNYTWIVTEVPVEGHGKAEGVTARPGEKLLTSGDEIVWASDPEGFLVKAWKTGQGLPSQCRMESGEAGAGTGQGGLSQCRMESGETGVKAGREIRTGVYTVDGVSVYAEAMGAEQHIVICGGGHIAAAMIRMAKMTDFRVTVIEDREELEAPSYEAGADTVLIGN